VSFALGSEYGPRADVPRKLHVTEPAAKRTRALAMYRHRLEGLTDAEIGLIWGRSREYINRQINALIRACPEAVAEVRRQRSRSRRADLLLREAEMADA
jgi:DNA-binding CsgD family transcriptional regulator